MTVGGKCGNPKPGFPLFPPPLEIAERFPHSHRPDSSFILTQGGQTPSEKCYLCRRAKVLPMSPAAPFPYQHSNVCVAPDQFFHDFFADLAGTAGH